jgi:acyl dehydratase
MIPAELVEGAVFTRNYRVDESVYQGFMATFGDRNPLHTDAAYARVHGFREPVMHGNILGGFVSHFVGEGLPSRQLVLHGQALRFRKPVYLGDELALEATLVHVSAAVGALEFSLRFRNAAGETVATGTVQAGVLRG